MANHKQKIKVARKILAKGEKKTGVSGLFLSKNWDLRRKAKAEKDVRRKDIAHTKAMLRVKNAKAKTLGVGQVHFDMKSSNTRRRNAKI